MTDYRVYKLDSSGKTIGPPLIVYGEDDDAALIIAKRTMAGEGHTIEIWDGGRRITTIPSDLDGMGLLPTTFLAALLGYVLLHTM